MSLDSKVCYWQLQEIQKLHLKDVREMISDWWPVKVMSNDELNGLTVQEGWMTRCILEPAAFDETKTSAHAFK